MNTLLILFKISIVTVAILYYLRVRLKDMLEYEQKLNVRWFVWQYIQKLLNKDYIPKDMPQVSTLIMLFGLRPIHPAWYIWPWKDRKAISAMWKISNADCEKFYEALKNTGIEPGDTITEEKVLAFRAYREHAVQLAQQLVQQYNLIV